MCGMARRLHRADLVGGGCLFSGAHNKDYSLLGVYIGVSCFGNLPCIQLFPVPEDDAALGAKQQFCVKL